MACCKLRWFWKLKSDFCRSSLFFVCFWDLKVNVGVLQFKVSLEIGTQFLFRNHVFFGMPSIYEIQRVACCNLRSFWKLKSDFFRNYVFFGMPSRSEVQRWLVAIWSHSGNRNQFSQKSCLCLVCFRDVKLHHGLLQFNVILEFEVRILQKFGLLRYAFEIWNSTVACCKLRSFWKSKYDFSRN